MSNSFKALEQILRDLELETTLQEELAQHLLNHRFRVNLLHSAADRLQLVLRLEVSCDGHDERLVFLGHLAGFEEFVDALGALVAIHKGHAAVSQDEPVVALVGNFAANLG